MTVLPAGFGSLYLKVLERLEPTADGCQVWYGPVSQKGYGRVADHRAPGRSWYVHRVMFAYANGWLPERPYEVDHLCRVRACAQATHLEAVSHQVNIDRGAAAKTDTCQAGHVWDEVGWWDQGAKGRKCKACHRKVAREWARRKKVTRSIEDSL